MALKVFITVDTEFTVDSQNPSPEELNFAIQRDLYGKIGKTTWGIEFILETFRNYQLKANFFIEALAESIITQPYLAKIIQLCQAAEQDIQLHVHTEWLRLKNKILNNKYTANIKDFTLEDQVRILEEAKANLMQFTNKPVQAFRAGNFGANLDTLSALHKVGIPIDSSYNISYRFSPCDIPLCSRVMGSLTLNNVELIPVTNFRDGLGRLRHLQITACSAAEVKQTLLRAVELGWEKVVIVMHSFELIRRHGPFRKRPLPDGINIHRFNELCRFLGANKNKFITCTMAEEASRNTERTMQSVLPEIRVNSLYTGWRLFEQAQRKVQMQYQRLSNAKRF